MKLELKETKDGSHTLYVPELNEHYHSQHGAVQEALHVFINHGLKPLLHQNRPLNILEVGWGTGLNCLLTCQHCGETNIDYTGVEAFPIQSSLHEKLNYVQSLKIPNELYKKMTDAPWEIETEITSNFHLTKVHATIQEWHTKNSFDLIYFDAFGPRAQEEMWQIETLEKVVRMLRLGGVFITYCAKGQLKRDLKALGCYLETLPGPPGKREMTRASKV
ncbi:MAG: tRNA (5-methylaminomethyl-2-thiouridine)(34)-methyltransferase MnmD [Bacteroidetes bacterium]|nr:tRNA (5-methylaminomethyl-2-thiouridine)(34)-methyltransferase MnmD [Bacteroidota bacterium]